MTHARVTRIAALASQLASVRALLAKRTAELAMVRHVNRLYARENEKLIDQKLAREFANVARRTASGAGAAS
jgi:hypothetical protein